ncbi:hypothetical protein INT46_006902 [Mucor plumbeus]|uniref:Uncharacterized protein n=1 Tax=Mucor plumbeus TaxID=97098 RepID=A0A8H7QI26_9FUNG|nr:hypothetical protein INT46_006902 [Mucor plumbeus]
MSDHNNNNNNSNNNNNNTFQRKIKKFSKFITTKVKEKTLSKSQIQVEEDQEDEDEIFQDSIIARRHSSYIHQPVREPTAIPAITRDQAILKQDLYQHYHTMPPATLPTTSALSPPPRQTKSKTVSGDKANLITKPCLSRSNTLGCHTPIKNPSLAPIHHSSFSSTTMSSSSSSYNITSPPSSTSLSSLKSQCNVNRTLIN